MYVSSVYAGFSLFVCLCFVCVCVFWFSVCQKLEKPAIMAFSFGTGKKIGPGQELEEQEAAEMPAQLRGLRELRARTLDGEGLDQNYETIHPRQNFHPV